MSLCIRSNLSKVSQSSRKKFRQVIKSKIMYSLYHGRHCNHKTLKRAIPDLNYVPSRWSMCKFSIKSYETLIKFWDQFAEIRPYFAKKIHQRCLIGYKIRLWISVNIGFSEMWNSKFKIIPKEYREWKYTLRGVLKFSQRSSITDV